MAAITSDRDSIRIRVPHWSSPRHPIYSLETRRRIQNRVIGLLQLGCMPAIFAATMLALAGIVGTMLVTQMMYSSSWYDYQYVIPVILGWAAGTMALIQLGAGAMANILVIAQAAPIISGEVELQSWGLLRTTTLSLREIFFAKYAAILTQFRTPLFALMLLRVISTLTIILLVGYSIIQDMFYYQTWAEWLRQVARFRWLPVFVAAVPWLVFYAGQPVIQLLLNTALGMAASAYARTRGQAVAAGLVLRLGVWVTTGLLNGSAIFVLNYLSSQWRYPSYVGMGLPYLPEWLDLWSTWLTVAFYGASVLAAQMGMILVALGLSLRRARTLVG